MKTMTEILQDLKSSFFKKTKLDVQDNGVMDGFFYATADGLAEAHKAIEANKTPNIWTGLDSDGFVSTGYMVNIPKEVNETDNSYKFRIINWTKINEASNSTAIEAALINVDHVSNAKYVPLTNGVGTATIYIIPNTLAEADLAIEAVQEKLKKVVSPGSYIEYVIPNILPVRLIVYVSSETGDMEYIKSNILTKVQNYINSIAPGDYLEIGMIDKIGVNEPNVDYFRVAELFINEDQIQNTKILQKLESKFLLQDDGIVWWTAVK